MYHSTYHNGWNFVTAGFVERQADRYQATVNGKLADNHYMVATMIDTVASIGAIATGGRVAGAILSKTGGNLLSGGLSSAAMGAAGEAEFTLIQKGGELGAYAATGYLPGGKKLDAAYARESFTELATSTAMGAGLGFLGPILGDRLRANYKIVWNSPNTWNPLKFRLVEPRTATKGLRLLGSEADTTGGSILAHAGGELTLPSGMKLSLPNAGTMNLAQATQWLNEQAARIPQMLNLNARLREQAINAVNLKNALTTAARNAMDNSSHVMQLGLTNPIRTFSELREEFGKKLSGDALYRKIVEEAKNVAPRTSIQKGGYCFAAGTLVHTREGLKPIETLKVGDWVLSKPESGEGEQAYKRITNTFCFQEKEVMHVDVYQRPTREEVLRFVGPICPNHYQSLVVTPNHPFWIVGANGDVWGWTPASDLWPDGQSVAIAGGAFAYVSAANNLYRTPTEGLGWAPMEAFSEEGMLVDLRGESPVADAADRSNINNPGVDPYYYEPDTELLITVYNIEVEDYHTYFVGEMGVWVHNTNCDGTDPVRERIERDAVVLSTRNTRVYRSEADANNIDPPFIGPIDMLERNFGKHADKYQEQAEGALLLREKIEVKGKPGEFEEALFHVAPGLRMNMPGSQQKFFMADSQAWMPGKQSIQYSKTLIEVKSGNGGKFHAVGQKDADGLPTDDAVKSEKALTDYLKRASFALNTNPDYSLVIEIELAPGANAIKEFIAKHVAKEPWFNKNIYVVHAQPLASGATQRTLPDVFQGFGQRKNAAGEMEWGVINVAKSKVLKPMDETPNPLGEVVDTFRKNDPKNQDVLAQGSHTGLDALSLADIERLLPAARQYWIDAGMPSWRLGGAEWIVGDLPPGVAGQTSGNRILMSRDGAGWGWFVDATPAQNEEFAADQRGLNAPADSAASGKLDLLTVMIHELGRVLGLDDGYGDQVMSQALETGERRLPEAQQRLRVIQSVATTPASAWTAMDNPRPTLENGDLSDDTAWQTSGNISFDSDGHAVLGELVKNAGDAIATLPGEEKEGAPLVFPCLFGSRQSMAYCRAGS